MERGGHGASGLNLDGLLDGGYVLVIKKKSHENLSSENIKKVIELLNSTKSITKKEACEILNISYNTTRLQRIIEDYNERIAYTTKRKAMNRGKSATKQEIQEAVIDYLQGYTYSEIAKSMFRSTTFIKNMLDKIGVPQRGSNQEEKARMGIIPEECRAKAFQLDEIVWSAKYHSVARIRSELTDGYIDRHMGLRTLDYNKLYLGNCYSIYVMEKVDAEGSFFPNITSGGFNAYAPAYDLGKLEHLKQFGINLELL